VIALPIVATRVSDGTRSDVVLAISTLKAGLTNALVVLSVVNAFGAIFARFLRAASDVDVANLTLESWSTLTLVLFALVNAFRLVLAELV
jgi:hypothetical protein